MDIFGRKKIKALEVEMLAMQLKNTRDRIALLGQLHAHTVYRKTVKPLSNLTVVYDPEAEDICLTTMHGELDHRVVTVEVLEAMVHMLSAHGDAWHFNAFGKNFNLVLER